MFVFLNSLPLVLIILLGLVVGSFLGAVTYRIPRGLSFWSGRSFCDNCGIKLPWFVNIPVFSFLFLRGKSHCCHKKIPVRYPLIEISTALGFIFINFVFGLNAFYYLLFLLTLLVFIIDLENQIIPDELSLVLFLFSFLIPIDSTPLFSRLFTGFLFSSFLLLIHLFTKGRGMGLGDVKLAIALGSWLGLYKGLIWMFASFLTGGILASILLIGKKVKLKEKIAFGPFLIIGFWIVLIL